MKTLKSTLLFGAVCYGLGDAEARSAKNTNSLGKAVRNRATKSINAEKPRFSQFFGDLVKGFAGAALGGMMGQQPGMQGMPGQPGMPGVPGQPGAPGQQPQQIDLNPTKQLQQQMEQKLQDTAKIGEELDEAVDTLEKTSGANDRKGIDFNIHVEDPTTSEEIKAEEIAHAVEEQSAPPPLYTAPVIVLLPPEPTPIEKLEFARAVACRGRMGSPEAKAQRTAELAELSSIKGHTITELLTEEKSTEATLEKLKADRSKVHEELRQVESNKAAGASSESNIFFLKEDLKLQDQKIAMTLDKLKRVESRIHKLKRQERGGGKGKEEEEEEEED